jgi:predicted RND superfamily exporter protein
MLSTFFSINASDTNSIIGYGSDLIGNFMPILVILIGIAIAVFIIHAIFTMK